MRSHHYHFSTVKVSIEREVSAVAMGTRGKVRKAFLEETSLKRCRGAL